MHLIYTQKKKKLLYDKHTVLNRLFFSFKIEGLLSLYYIFYAD